MVSGRNTELTFRAALYARVSTSEQDVSPQLDVLREYAQRRGLDVSEEYVDQGVSGGRARRPALDRLVADARRRRFDVVACVKLDRLARSVHHLTTLAREFEALGVDLLALDQGIDTTTPSGRFLFHTLGAVAELERDLIRERTKAGMEAARRRGKRIGRPRAELDPQVLRQGLSSGASVSELARRLGVSRATVRKALGGSGVAERVSE